MFSVPPNSVPSFRQCSRSRDSGIKIGFVSNVYFTSLKLLIHGYLQHYFCVALLLNALIIELTMVYWFARVKYSQKATDQGIHCIHFIAVCNLTKDLHDTSDTHIKARIWATILPTQMRLGFNRNCFLVY